ncbi:YrhK family protein [Cellulomonas sp. URHE0023]|uniref:YrhK family protein n=1 Tax=Cellulomonas sp. URHE0023 TaxID=1380354 RepID=UPI000AB0BC9F|nr:YrhK family protein [Cellulomonas sp. URHE0023]
MTVSTTIPDLPEGWAVVETSGPASFVTGAVLERPDGSRVHWSSRRHRKGLGLVEDRILDPARTWVGRPTALSWWIGSLFAVGSICFALGSLPVYVDNVAAPAVAWTFFIGSVFFTSAGYLQYREAVAAPEGIFVDRQTRGPLRRMIGWKPRRLDFWAAFVQLVGTVFFNVTTFAATRSDLTLAQERHLIWAPDVLGSVAFLVASWFAYSEVNRGILPRSDRSTGWRISALNLIGSIAFGASAVGARYVRSTGELANLALVNLGTFVGAVCFLVGAALLPVESARDRVPEAASTP